MKLLERLFMKNPNPPARYAPLGTGVATMTKKKLMNRGRNIDSIVNDAVNPKKAKAGLRSPY